MDNQRRGWLLAALVAVAWAMGPLLPALLRGQIPGHGLTDLYPAVWGLGWFVRHIGDVWPHYAPELSAPAGMPFVYSSPLHGFLAVPLQPVIGTAGAYAAGLVVARAATVLCAYGAGRALDLRVDGALVLAVVYGASPFFHGFAVEGTIEGTDGWALALWVWMAAERRDVLAVLAAALTVLASWYLAWVGVVAAIAVLPWSWRAGLTFFAGAALASPAAIAFFAAFSQNAPMDPLVRSQMGAPWWPFPIPGSFSGTAWSGRSTWIGWTAGALALCAVRKRPWWALAAGVAFAISLGIGPLYDLPVWDRIRFPYRMHAGTLLALGVLAGTTLDGWVRPWVEERIPRLGAWVGPVVALLILGESLALAPVEPILPGAERSVPAILETLRGKVVLDIPGPLARPPGEANGSRRRAQGYLYQLGEVGARTPWAPDFNGVGVSTEGAPVLAAVRSWDPLEAGVPTAFTASELRAAGIDAVVLHRGSLGKERTAELRAGLLRDGATLSAEGEGLVVFALE